MRASFLLAQTTTKRAAPPPATAAGHAEMESLAYLGSGGLCIAAIACLANQKTARLGE